MSHVWKKRNRSYWLQATFRGIPVLCSWVFALWPIWFGGPSRAMALAIATGVRMVAA